MKFVGFNSFTHYIAFYRGAMKFVKYSIYILFIILTILFMHVVNTHAPDSLKPWKPIDLNDDIGVFTSLKLSHLKTDLNLCQSALKTSNAKFTLLPDRQVGQCLLENQINLKQSRYLYSAPVSGQCALIASLILWEDNVVAKAAKEYLDSEIASIQHYGILSCRNVRGSSRPSQHASANAIDIAGFTLKDGSTISLKRDWGQDNAKGRFLKAIRDGSCDIFSGVLGPDYNTLHADHFHLDLGPYNICR